MNPVPQRIYDPCTDTWAYDDGSGFLTGEQIIELKGINNALIRAAAKEYFYKKNKENFNS